MILIPPLPDSSHDFGWIRKKNITKYGRLLCLRSCSRRKIYVTFGSDLENRKIGSLLNVIL